MLIDNGADLSYGDMAQYACTAAQQNSIELLKDIVNYGGDVTLPRSDGSTALHLAVCEGNVEMVKFLLEQGADIDKQDIHGWSPGELAEQQGHEEIKSLFQTKKAFVDENPTGDQKDNDFSTESSSSDATRFLGRFRSEPALTRESGEGRHHSGKGSGKSGRRKPSSSNPHSLFGFMSTHFRAGFESYPVHQSHAHHHCVNHHHVHNHPVPLRVKISCPERPDVPVKLVLLPRSIEELLSIATKKFGFRPVKLVTEDGAEVDDVRLIRDGDHLLLVSNVWRGRTTSCS